MFSLDNLVVDGNEIIVTDDSGNPIEVKKIGKNYGCKATHTYMLGTGECACDPSYPYGDPSIILGCFQCPPECHKFSSCMWPGQCKCNPGYIGTLRECHPETPIFKGIEPDNVYSTDKYKGKVRYNMRKRVNFSHLYLQYRDDVITCNISSNSTYDCIIDSVGPPGVIDLKISFDKETWSKDLIEFTVYPPQSQLIDYVAYLILVIIIAVVSFLIYTKQTNDKTLISESMPLIGKTSEANV